MALNLPLDANRPNVRVGSISGVVTVLHDVRYPDERTSPSASVRSEKCRFRTHAPQTKTYSITSIGACEQRLRHGWPTTLHRLLAPGRCLLSLAAA
jgi:hypothetical protein